MLLIAFYLAGTYLVLLPLSMVAPGWVKPLAGLLILASVGITVQLLSMAMSNLRGIALYRAGERAGLATYASQAVLLLGHLGSFYFASGLLREGTPVPALSLLLMGGLYLVGVTIAIGEWRGRRNARAS